MKIGEVAARSGVSTTTLRYYEKIGIIAPPPRRNGVRHYDASVLARLRLIKWAQQAGFTLREIGGLVAGDPPQPWPQQARQKLDALDAQIAALVAMRSQLQQSLACGCEHPATCDALA